MVCFHASWYKRVNGVLVSNRAYKFFLLGFLVHMKLSLLYIKLQGEDASEFQGVSTIWLNLID